MANEEAQVVAAKAANVAFQEVQLDPAAQQRVQSALHDALVKELGRGGGNPAAFFGSGSVMGLNAVEQLTRLGQQLNQPGQ